RDISDSSTSSVSICRSTFRCCDKLREDGDLASGSFFFSEGRKTENRMVAPATMSITHFTYGSSNAAERNMPHILTLKMSECNDVKRLARWSDDEVSHVRR